jgi:hypothetical protein
MVLVGDILSYNGMNVKVTRAGVVLKDNCSTPSLRSAIEDRGWLRPIEEVPPAKPSDGVPLGGPSHREEYNETTGGNFGEFVRKNGINPPKMEVVTENDMTVRTLKSAQGTQNLQDSVVTPKKLTVDRDQSFVRSVESSNKEKFIVSSSTAVGKPMPHSRTVERAETENTIPMKPVPGMASAASTKKTFQVTDTTPRPSDGAGLSEMNRITTPIKQQAKSVAQQSLSDSQVVKTLAPTGPAVTTVDGITMRKSVRHSADVVGDQDGVEVKKIGEPRVAKVNPEDLPQQSGLTQIPAREKRAPVRVEKRGLGNYTKDQPAPKVSEPVPTMDSVPDAPPPTHEAPPAAKEVTVPEDASPVESPKPKAKAASTKKTEDYTSKLPEDWTKLHWVKAEKFINDQTDPDFVRFILKIEKREILLRILKEKLNNLLKK